MTERRFQVVQCLRCRHIWDDEDPEDFVCPCINDYGNRTVEVLSEGWTNTPKYIKVGLEREGWDIPPEAA